MKSILSISTLVVAAILFGCAGPKGDPGVGIEDTDKRPPEVRLTYPMANTDLPYDTTLLAAEATDSAGAIKYVRFLVNGSSRIGESDSAVVFFPPYRYLYDFRQAGTPLGTITISAEAVDTSGNHQMTPISLNRRILPVGPDTLAYFTDVDAGDGFGFPNAFVYDDSTQVLPGMAVWFTPIYRCELRALQIQFGDPEIYGDTIHVEPTDFVTVLWNVDEGGRPTTKVDSIRTSVNQVVYNSWVNVDLSNWQNGTEPYRFDVLQDFALSIQPAVQWSDTLRRGLVYPLRLDDPPANSDPVTDRSFFWIKVGERQYWGSTRELFAITKFDCVVRLIVENIPTEELSPGGAFPTLPMSFRPSRQEASRLAQPSEINRFILKRR